MGSHRIKRQTIEGYLDMGKPFIPPPPAKIALVDRSNGLTYYLMTSGTYPALAPVVSTIVVTDQIAGVNVYAAFNGPVLNTQWRLLSTGGTLSVELILDPAASQTRIFARNGNSRSAIELTAPGGVLTYTNILL